MDPRWLFPVLAGAFALAAAIQLLRMRRWRGSVSTWALLALIFAAVATWLNHRS